MLKHGLQQAYQSILFEWETYWLHRKGMTKVKEYFNRKPLKLHLACGEVYKDGWVNIDLTPGIADACLDLRRQLPFPNDSCDEVYSEHFLEHLSYPHDAVKFLSELKRILKPGGRAITSVPDTEWPMKSYAEGKQSEYFRIAKEKYHPADCTTMMEHLNYHFRQSGEHLFAYDEETLVKVLEQAGFTNNQPRAFDPSMDSASRHPGSLYVISIKD